MKDNLKYSWQLDEKEPRWFAVYTKFKNEKYAVKFLKEKGIHAYVPIKKYVRQYTRKRKEVFLPIFSCYIFVKIIKKEYIPVLDSPGVVRFIRFRNNLIAIPEHEIDWIKMVVGENLDFEVEQGAFNIGDAVEIIAGNLSGMKGRLVESAGKHNFLLVLDRFGYTLRLTVNHKLLRKTADK